MGIHFSQTRWKWEGGGQGDLKGLVFLLFTECFFGMIIRVSACNMMTETISNETYEDTTRPKKREQTVTFACTKWANFVGKKSLLSIV